MLPKKMKNIKRKKNFVKLLYIQVILIYKTTYFSNNNYTNLIIKKLKMFE